MATKTQYNAEQEAAIIEAVEGVENYIEQREALEDLGESMGKTIRSLTAKLSSLHKAGKCAFIKKEYTKDTNAGGKPAEKSVLVGFIAELIGENVELMETLEKANKTALVKLFSYLNGQVLALELEEQDEVEA